MDKQLIVWQVAMLALVNANNFYASCETVYHPDLCKKPIVVISNNDGCVISRSAESKALDIKTGDPLFKNECYVHERSVVVFSLR